MRRTVGLRASVGSTEASNGRLARVGVVGPKRAIIDPIAPKSHVTASVYEQSVSYFVARRFR